MPVDSFISPFRLWYAPRRYSSCSVPFIYCSSGCALVLIWPRSERLRPWRGTVASRRRSWKKQALVATLVATRLLYFHLGLQVRLLCMYVCIYIYTYVHTRHGEMATVYTCALLLLAVRKPHEIRREKKILLLQPSPEDDDVLLWPYGSLIVTVISCCKRCTTITLVLPTTM